MRADHGFRGEQSHLGIVGDCTNCPVCLCKITNSRLAKLGVNHFQGQEFDGRAECITDCTAKQASLKTIADVRSSPCNALCKSRARFAFHSHALS